MKEEKTKVKVEDRNKTHRKNKDITRTNERNGEERSKKQGKNREISGKNRRKRGR